MTTSEIIARRLHNQLLTNHKFKRPEEVVKYMGAMQSQDYPGAKWGIGARLDKASNSVIEKAVNDGKIVRTHIMRPTWHFVAPEDLRWMQKLTSPRVKRVVSYYDKRQGIDTEAVEKAKKVITKALHRKHLTRPELGEHLKKAEFTLRLNQLAHYVMHAELDALICSGTNRGKSITYALVDERVKKSKALSREESLAELTRRYFTSHGPATAHDFSWWSGLTMAEVRIGIELVKSEFEKTTAESKVFWFPDIAPKAKDVSRITYLLPNYDEYGIAYKDRRAIMGADDLKKIGFAHPLIIGGKLAGVWTRLPGGKVKDIKFFRTPDKTQKKLVEKAKFAYESFIVR